ncbi:MAG: Ig-like domain-containing protein [Verrucomicrobiia bacterium]
MSALTTADYAVLASAQVATNPPTITLKWNLDNRATNYSIYRKAIDETQWNLISTESGSSTSFTDINVVKGSYYEYWISKSGLEGTTAFKGDSWILSAIEAPAVDERGGLILIVENVAASNLSNELERLTLDLVGDGWFVIRHNVSASATPQEIKAIITNDYYSSAIPLKAVFLLGKVPVPYSGQIAPDGHTDHIGAWPADIYYADVDGVWTDSTVNYTNSSNQRLTNIAGDGKFDQSQIPSDSELWIGRVDLSNMPAFSLSEIELLRKYLWKEHNFRFNFFKFQKRGLIDDNFGTFYGEAFAASAWRDFSAFFGSSSIISGDYFTNLSSSTYLWSYGCGAGSYTGASGVGSTDQFASTPVYTIFTMLFGSYFGDWDSQNNFIRAALCYPSFGLTCGWSGRPHWHCHSMAVGFPIGYSAFMSQNNDYQRYSENSISKREIHIALMGDPTLRMHVVPAPQNLRCSINESNNTVLTWQPPKEQVKGYIVYGATNIYGRYIRLHNDLLTTTNYIDTSAAHYNYYIVKSVRLETSASGSYFNTSQGIFQSAPPLQPLAPAVSISEPVQGAIFSAPAKIKISADIFDYSAAVAKLQFYNGDLKLGEVSNPPYEFIWQNVPAGIYEIYVKVQTHSGELISSKPSIVQVNQTIIEKGSVWSYLDDGSDAGIVWRLPKYDDSGWKSGAAELGYSNAPVTVVSFGDDPANKFITTYFRRRFYVENPNIFTNLIAGLKRDDGAIVYINGEEAIRSNMPQGNVNYRTLASTAVGGTDESAFFIYNISPRFLVKGTNLIAVEVHQNSPSSSDLSFDLYLYGTSKSPEFKINIAIENDSRIRVEYPALSPLIKIQTTTNFLGLGSWQSFSPSLTQSNGYNIFFNSPADEKRYYRLILE